MPVSLIEFVTLGWGREFSDVTPLRTSARAGPAARYCRTLRGRKYILIALRLFSECGLANARRGLTDQPVDRKIGGDAMEIAHS